MPKKIKPKKIRKAPFVLLAITISVAVLVYLGYQQYNDLYSKAKEVLKSLQTLQTLVQDFSVEDSLKDSVILQTRLDKIEEAVKSSRAEFDKLQVELQNKRWILDVSSITPFYSRLETIYKLSDLAPYFFEAGSEGIKAARELVSLTENNGELGINLTEGQITNLKQHSQKIYQALKQGNKLLEAIPVQELAFNANLEQQVRKLKLALPSLLEPLSNSEAYLDSMAVLLGIGEKPATYLVLVQDSSELRPTGGFIGNYAIVSVNKAKVDSLNFDNIYNLDDPYLAQHPLPVPEIYQKWWAWPDRWGLRDVNLTPDFPETALMAEELATKMGATSQPITGVVAINPSFIANLLRVLGPIRVVDPVNGFDDTVDADNLVEKLHYYQLKPGQHDGDQFYKRKLFTQLLANEMLQRVKKATKPELAQMVKSAYHSFETKDLLAYVDEKPIQQLLEQKNLSGEVFQKSAENNPDYYYVVDSNIGENKGNRYLEYNVNDLISFDKEGTTRHKLKIDYNYKQALDFYEIGRDPTYRGYSRIYLPLEVQNLARSGFLRSDEPVEQYGRGVWGQLAEVKPLKSTSTGLNWSVPNPAAQQKSTYSLVVQRQPGANINYQLALVPPDGMEVFALFINGTPTPISTLEGNTKLLYQAVLTKDLNISVVFMPKWLLGQA